MSSSTLHSAEATILATLIVAYALWFAVWRLRTRRPELRIGPPLAVGLAIRLAVSAGIGAAGLGPTLRGSDETTFLDAAKQLASSSWGSGFWIPDSNDQLHTVLFAVQMKAADFPPGAMRVTQVGMAMLGLVLILAAVHDLAGPRAAQLGAWVLALEPAGVFFDSVLHKESLMVLASGLVVLGCTRIWQRLDLGGMALVAVGGLVAIATRPYAGWFLLVAAGLLLLHASLRRLDRPMRAMPVLYAVVIAAAVAAPSVIEATSPTSLEQLQVSQDANTDPRAKASSTGANENNLALEQVDFSTRSEIVTNLPKRVRDVVLRPYPWQLANTSQQLGAVGTLVALVALWLLARYAWRSRGRILPRAAPILYPLAFLLIAYALSVGNAGTGFRYRTHIVTLGLALLVVLREHVLRDTRLAGEFAVDDKLPA